VSRALSSIEETFVNNVESVKELMNFDRLVLEFAIKHLEQLQKRLVEGEGLTNPRFNVERALEVLRGIRQNDSLRIQYQHIVNQCDVLLVSHFESALRGIFRVSLLNVIRTSANPKLLDEQLRMTLRDVQDAGAEIHERITDLLIAQKGFSFNDMGSIARAFGEYVGCEPPRTPEVNDIILAQAGRHVIVHAGAVVDERFVRQVAGANPRHVKPEMTAGQEIRFTPDEIETISKSMLTYVNRLVKSVPLHES
jgi:hypothetical protein